MDGDTPYEKEATTPPDNGTSYDCASRMPMLEGAYSTGVIRSSRNQNDDVTDLPPLYQSAAAPFRPALAEKGLTKVAMLPLAGPSAGFEYLHSRLSITGHDYLLPRGSDNRISIPVVIYRMWKCEKNLRCAT